jgi:hypothetical protein
MAETDNKTIEEQLAEADAIVAAKKAKEKRDRAKKKADEAKADAEYKAKEEIKTKYAKENMDRASSYSAYKSGGPQEQSGKESRTRENLKKIDKQVVATEYSQVIRNQNSFIEKYKKTGDAADRQAAINYQSKVDAAAKKYSDVVGHAPTGYTGKLDLPPAPEPVVKPGSTNTPGTGVGSASNAAMESRDAARSAGRNAAPAPARSSTLPAIDPNVVKDYMTSNPGMTYDQAVAALYGGPVDDAGTGTYSSNTSIDKRVQTFTAQQLEGAATQYAQQLLGRALTAAELASVTNFTNAQAIANPEISKTVSSSSGYSQDGSSSSSSRSSTTTSGGIDSGQLIKSQIEENPEYAAYQKATTYFDSMLSALRGPVGGGI